MTSVLSWNILFNTSLTWKALRVPEVEKRSPVLGTAHLPVCDKGELRDLHYVVLFVFHKQSTNSNDNFIFLIATTKSGNTVPSFPAWSGVIVFNPTCSRTTTASDFRYSPQARLPQWRQPIVFLQDIWTTPISTGLLEQPFTYFDTIWCVYRRKWRGEYLYKYNIYVNIFRMKTRSIRVNSFIRICVIGFLSFIFFFSVTW